MSGGLSKFSEFVFGPAAVAGDSNEVRSVRPFVSSSVFLSGRFPGIGTYIFSETWNGVKRPYVIVPDGAGFLRKIPNLGKNGQTSSKMAQNLDF